VYIDGRVPVLISRKKEGHMAAKRKRQKKQPSRAQPLNALEGLPPRGAVIAGTARAPKSGCGPCEWKNTGATLVGGKIVSVTQAGFRTCSMYLPVVGPNRRVDYYKVTWTERCGGTRKVTL
jgi:hypothetical protein